MVGVLVVGVLTSDDSVVELTTEVNDCEVCSSCRVREAVMELAGGGVACQRPSSYVWLELEDTASLEVEEEEEEEEEVVEAMTDARSTPGLDMEGKGTNMIGLLLFLDAQCSAVADADEVGRGARVNVRLGTGIGVTATYWMMVEAGVGVAAVVEVVEVEVEVVVCCSGFRIASVVYCMTVSTTRDVTRSVSVTTATTVWTDVD